MKKIAAIAIAAALVSGMAFAAGPVSISIDAKTDVWSKNSDAKGMKTDINYEDYLGQLVASYDTEVGGGMLRFWVNNNAASQGSAPQSVWAAQNSLFLNRWAAYIKPVAGLKVGMMTAPYEIFAREQPLGSDLRGSPLRNRKSETLCRIHRHKKPHGCRRRR